MRNITDELFNGGGIVYVIIFYTNDLCNLYFFFFRFTGFVYAKSVLMVIPFIVLCVCVSVCA